MAKLSDAQFGALRTLVEFGPIKAVEVFQAPKMDGTRKLKLECNQMAPATLAALESFGFVAVTRTKLATPVNAVGKSGNRRIGLVIAVTNAGKAAFSRQDRRS